MRTEQHEQNPAGQRRAHPRLEARQQCDQVNRNQQQHTFFGPERPGRNDKEMLGKKT